MSAQTDYWADRATKTTPTTNHNYTPAQQQQVSESITTPKGTMAPILSDVNSYNQLPQRIKDLNYKSMNFNYNEAKRISDEDIAYGKTPMGIAEPYIKNASALVGGVASLASIYTGLETLKLQKKADARADEVWALQKEELSAVRAVRSKNESRMTEMEADPNSMYYRG